MGETVCKLKLVFNFLQCCSQHQNPAEDSRLLEPDAQRSPVPSGQGSMAEGPAVKAELKVECRPPWEGIAGQSSASGVSILNEYRFMSWLL